MGKNTYATWVKAYAVRYWWIFLLLALLTLLTVGITVLDPVPLAFMADYVFGDKPPLTVIGITLDFPKEQLLLLAVASYLIIYIFGNVYTSFRIIIEQKLFQIIDASAMKDVFNSALHIPYNNAKKEDDGDVLYKTTSQSQEMSTLLFGNFSTLFESGLTIISMLSILFVIDSQMTIFALLVVPVLIFIVHIFSEPIEKRAEEAQGAESNVFEHITESLAKIRAIQEFGLERRKTDELGQFIKKSNKTFRRSLLINRVYSVFTESTILVAIAAIMLFGGYSVINGTVMTFGTLLLFINYISFMSDPLVTIVQTLGSIREQIISIKQAREVIDSSIALRPVSGKINDIPLVGRINFNHVNYSINDKVVVNDLSVEFNPGNIYVITGPSGEGKSTLVGMIQRFVTPLLGSITIDNIDIRDFDIEFLRSKIAIVDQTPELFKGTVQDNIAVSDPKRPFSLLHVIAATYVSNSTNFIDKLPDKYETLVDDEKLSGGQRQRISIARAGYREAPIMILDEPTSALDKTSAEIFLNNLNDIKGEKTIIIVTHDINVIRKFEHVYTLNDGELTPTPRGAIDDPS